MVEAMGVSQSVLEEVQCIVGRMPTVEELSTLLAMWESNGRQQSLLAWLRGQHHVVERHEYLYDGDDSTHKEIREPRVRDCIPLAREVTAALHLPPLPAEQRLSRGSLLYMVGRVATGFLDSAYARRCLHLVENPVRLDNGNEELAYLQMILTALRDADVVSTCCPVGTGGLFTTLVRCCDSRVGFDILTCREVRLDAFLFGEDGVRMLISLPETQDDFFLQKMDEARVDCCFLGHATKGRVLVDDMDYGSVVEFLGN